MDKTEELIDLSNDLRYHAMALGLKLRDVASTQPDPNKLKAAITRANKFLQDMHKYEVTDDD